MAFNAKDQSTDPPPIRIVFGAGLNSRKLEQNIDERECQDGHDFALDIGEASFSNRAPFDLVGTAPNGQSIQGYAQLVKSDGTISTLIQAGGTVYQWTGTTSGFTAVGTCPSSAKLRGKIEANHLPNGYALITDLSLQQPVMTWDGTTFTPLTTNLGALFYAKFCQVDMQRAFFANVIAGTATPHMLVVSKLGDPTTLSIANQPSSSLGAGDPFYILTPNLSAINGFPEAPATHVLSTQVGDIYNFTGSSSRDFALANFFPFAAPAGDEAIAYIENDVAYGRIGRVESLYTTKSYGAVEAAELSRPIANRILSVGSWTLVYDRRMYRLYCFPSGVQELWVLHKSIADGQAQYDGAHAYGVSPWSRWTTSHAIAFQPTCAWTMKRPSDGLFMVYMGDSSGNVYQMEGSGGLDGGTASLSCERLSRLYGIPDGVIFDVTGYVHYRQLFSATLTLTFEFAGSEQFDQVITVSLDPAQASSVYGGTGSTAAYYGGALGGVSTAYFGQRLFNRLTRRSFNVAGRSSHVRVRANVSGSAAFAVDEIVINVIIRKE